MKELFYLEADKNIKIAILDKLDYLHILSILLNEGLSEKLSRNNKMKTNLNNGLKTATTNSMAKTKNSYTYLIMLFQYYFAHQKFTN